MTNPGADHGFSEAAYGHVITSEIESRLCARGEVLLSAPDLPTLRKERHLGYDLRVNTNAVVVVLQFKLGKYVGRQHRRSPTWYQSGVKTAHYRVLFPAGHHQLALMQNLESTLASGSTHSVVRYIAPAFHTSADFDQHCRDRRVLENSYSCRPSRVPVDGVDHYLVHVPGGSPTPQLFSVPIDVSGDNLPTELSEVRNARSEAPADEDPRIRDSVPEVVLTAEHVLREHAEAISPEGIDLRRIDRQAAEAFEGRPDLQHAVICIELGLVLGLSIGFTAAIR